jgi:hypothetical protein
MHPYSAENNERLRVLIVIGFLSVFAAWGLHFILLQIPLVPWWIDLPSVLGFFTVFRQAFEKWLWRLALVRALIGITVPDLSGVWKGKLFSSYGEHTALDVKVVVSQNWTSMVLSLETDGSVSLSKTAAFVRERPGAICLHYNYFCEPYTGSSGSMHAHRGTGEIILKDDSESIEGSYYTGRDRRTFGTFTLSKVGPQKLAKSRKSGARAYAR